MSTEQSIIDLLSSRNPSDDDIQEAVDWIKSRKRSDKSAKKIVEMLMNIPQAGPRLSALTEWMETAKKWSCLESTSYKMASLEHLDWVLSLLSRNPSHPQAGSIWNNLLSSYNNREIFDGATDWLLKNSESDPYADSVAAVLVKETPSDKVIEISRRLLQERPLPLLLAQALLYQAPDRKTIEIGIQILENADPFVGSMVAGALAQSGQRGSDAVTKFLNQHRESKRFDRILDSLLYDARELALPYLLEWISKHPKSRDTERLLVELVIDEGSNYYADLLWTWCKTNAKKSDILNVMTILITTDAQVPADIVAYARNWLNNNENHSLWVNVFFRTLGKSNFEEQLDMLNHWRPKLSELTLSTAIGIIVQSTKASEQETVWTEISHRIPEVSISKIKREVACDSMPTINFPLAREVATGDPQAIERARDWLATRHLEFRWSSLHAYRGEVIEALLTVSSKDELVVKESESWLQKRPERHIEPIYQRVKALYDQHQ